jgi:flagella basal body P-ring formation protein FlgA
MRPFLSEQSFSRLFSFAVLVAIGIAAPARAAMDDGRETEARLVLRDQVTLATNVLRLRDVCDLSQSNESAKAIQDIPLAPTPRDGVVQSWTRQDIAKVLALRGMDPHSISWSGSESVRVSRAERRAVQPATAVEPIADIRLADNAMSATPRDFEPAFTTPVSITQAERVVTSAIESYLQLKTGSQGKWRIKPVIPPQHANALLQRRQIVSIAGGREPWDGNQTFAILLRTAEGESVVDIPAEVHLPTMVVAAKGPIARGRVLKDSDLVWLALPVTSKIAPEDCFSEFESLVGKQLRKAVSTQQPIRIQDVGEPFAIQAGDSVTIAVLAGSVRVEGYGRAIESGAIDDMIQIEVMPQKKRIAARVAAERRVEVIAGTTTPAKP